MKRIFAFILISGRFAVALGQLTVTASDFHSLNGSADSVWNYSSTDSSGLSAIIANSGADRTWDLSKRTFQPLGGTIVRYSSFPDGAPFSNDSAFASCNIVESLGDTASGAAWLYLTLNDNGFYSSGQVITGMKTTMVPQYPSYEFPLTYGSQWNGSYTTTSTYNGSQIGTASVSYINVVDGWGTVITPEGNFSCLRLRNSNESTASGTTITTVSYFFVGKTQTYATITSMSGSSGVSYSRTEILTGVKEEQPTEPVNFDLLQNYPNPFNPSTTISYHLASNVFAILKVTDVLGREVATLVNERQNAGDHSVIFDANNLPSGLYFYTLEAGTYHATKKFLLLK